MSSEEEVKRVLRFYYPKSFQDGSGYQESEGGQLMLQHLTNISSNPLPLTHLNQFLHLTHQAGVSEGFFKYYFLTNPTQHPYPVEKVSITVPALGGDKIKSLEQLDWGMRRFFIDALLYFGNVRTAYRTLRGKSYEKLVEYCSSKRYDTDALSQRSDVFPFHKIPVDDRYLIAEVACKAYSSEKVGDPVLLESILVDRYRRHGGKPGKLSQLFDDPPDSEADGQVQFMLKFAADEIADEPIQSIEDIQRHVGRIATRFDRARKDALFNTKLYLSIVNELDVYVATSMRSRANFRDMARDCEFIFKKESLKKLRLRYFDPTMSAAEGHEDKGLIECLMVKCAKLLLYFAGEGDSFGKDAEVAMALSLGKPVVILCPTGSKGREREKLFREIHPLSRLIHIDTGIACGAIVTQDRDVAAEIVARVLNNAVEYDLEQKGDGYFRLRERITKSVVRLQTNSEILREAFWNYYHDVP